MRELPKKLRQLVKPNTLVPVVFLLVFFLAAGFFAITQETGDEEKPVQDDPDGGSLSLEYEEAGTEPEFIPAGPPRWFRSNAGGMALEEIPSRLGALRNKYALVVDYVAPDELEPRLIPFYKEDYSIEIRILYMEGKESRKQWLFRDGDGNARVNAVFRMIQDEAVPGEGGLEEPALSAADTETEITDAETDGPPEDTLADTEEDKAASRVSDAEASDVEDNEDAGAELSAVESPGDESPEAKPPEALASPPRTPSGFIEVYNENGQISRDYSLFEEGDEILIEYFYNGKTLIRAETKIKDPEDWEYRKTHTDNYRYNRSYSLRNVERVYHEASGVDPVLLVFPGRALDAARDKDFLKEKLAPGSDFLGSSPVDADFRMVYDTDSRGRVLGETLYNGNGEVVWTVKNTWTGDRITSILKIEGDETKLTEYDYDSSGDRIAQRDIHNGVLERQVLINGNKETEELYMDGVAVIRAFWEDGRKIHEERVRRR
ncbi:MAG: hypothetical protein LBU85_09650 [Treponema sp.]|nr:hypothetical protein [Treponema sp.]